MRLFGLVGTPLTHSFSQLYFRNKFKTEHIPDSDYQLFDLSDIHDLSSLIDAHPALTGLNITAPYKQKVIPFLTRQDHIVEKTGSCNTIRIVRNSKIELYGYNTDYYGFKKSLLEFIPATIKSALILGNGGSAQTVKLVLDELHITHATASRSAAHGDKNSIRYNEISENLIHDTLLIINTTPLGMFPDTSAKTELPYSALTSGHYLMDLIYNPPETLFLQEGKKRGAFIRNGLQMLENQADKSWEIWNDPL